MNRRIIGSMLLILLVLLVNLLAPLTALQSTSAALLQAQQTTESYIAVQRGMNVFPVREIVLLVVSFALVMIWRKEIKALFQRLGEHIGVFAVLALLLFAACRPVSIVSKEPNETLFMVPVVGNTASQEQITNAQFENAQQVNSTEIEVPRAYVSTNYILGISTAGYYRPELRIYVVNTTPVTVRWETMTDAIPVESAESSGFSVPIIMSAYLAESDEIIVGTQELDADGVPIPGTGVTCKGAAVYLSVYGRKVEVSPDQIEVDARPLNSVLDTEVRGAIARELSALYAPIFIQDAVANKGNILNAVLDIIQPQFALQGVCISSFGTTSGLLYDDQGYQDQINNAANRSLDEAAAFANATTTAVYAGAAANATQIAVQGIATQRAVELMSEVQRAGVLATATVMSGEAQNEVLRRQAEVLASNPAVIEYAYANGWKGGCTQNCFGESGVVPFYNVNPQPTQTAP